MTKKFRDFDESTMYLAAICLMLIIYMFFSRGGTVVMAGY